MSKTHELDSKAITYIRSRAIDYIKNSQPTNSYETFKISQTREYISTYCYAKATVDYLVAHELLPQPVDFVDKMLQGCRHESVTQEINKATCTECGVKLRLLWIAENEN